MSSGWIKLHRRLLENAIARNPAWAWLWVCLLLKANHQPNKFMWNGQVIVVKEGQFITGRKELARETGVHESTIERVLNFLEDEQQIEQQKTTKYRLITIIKWNDYQQENNTSNNKRTTSEQQANTNKNDKNDKKHSASQGDARIPVIIDMFKEVNPSYRVLFGSPPQRNAVERLLKEHGEDKLKSMIGYLPKSNSSRYAPTITTPVQFEQRLGELISWSQKQKNSTAARQILI